MKKESENTDRVMRRELFRIRGWRLRLGAAIWMAAGIVVFVVSYLVDRWVPNANQGGFWPTFGPGFLRLVGSTGFAVGFISPLTELPTVMAYVSARVDELLHRDIADPRFLSTMPQQGLENAHASLLKVLYNADFETKEATPYRTLRTKIEPLIAEVFYQDLRVDLTNWVIREQGHCHIKSERYYRMEFLSAEDRELDLGFQRHLRKLPGKDPEQLYALKNLVIGGKTWTVHPDFGEDPRNGETIVDFPLLVTLPAGKAVVMERREIVLIPSWDIYQWVCREGRSLLRLSVKCSFDEELYPKVYARGFAFADNAPNEDAKSIYLNWQGWMLPHHGFVVSWNDPVYDASLACK